VSDRAQEIRERLDLATAGPWLAVDDPHEGALVKSAAYEDADVWICGSADDEQWPLCEEDAELIAHARSDLRWALECAQLLREALTEEVDAGFRKRIRALLQDPS